MTFTALGLAPELVRAVTDEGYTQPTPVQQQTIPHVLAGRDVLAAAQTGTGKTAAFVLPILQRLHATQPDPAPMTPAPGRNGHGQGQGAQAGRSRRIRALVLVPTRELALQVEESVRTYGRHRRVRSTTIYGGVGFEPQVRALRAGPAIVVATPGRLLDHTERGTIDLSGIEILVLDEADRMLDMGFIRDIRRILALLPARRQNLLLSATFSASIRSLAAGILDQPAIVDVAPGITTATLVQQQVIHVDRERKRELLSHLVSSGRVRQALVFTRTKHGANRLAQQLGADGIRAAAIHGNKSQSQRVRALEDFKTGQVDLLVATDIAARGLDIEALPHVVNYELPMVASDYVHRVGRTGRAGVGGDAISLVCVDEAGLLREIQSLVGRALPAEVVPGFQPDRAIRAEPIRLRTAGGAPHQGPSRGGAPRWSPGGRAPRRHVGVAPGRGAGMAPGRRAGAVPAPAHAGGDHLSGHSGSNRRSPGRRRPAGPFISAPATMPAGQGAPMPERRQQRQPHRPDTGRLLALPGERLSRIAATPSAPPARMQPGRQII